MRGRRGALSLERGVRSRVGGRGRGLPRSEKEKPTSTTPLTYRRGAAVIDDRYRCSEIRMQKIFGTKVEKSDAVAGDVRKP